MEEITVLIVEDENVKNAIIRGYFGHGVTFAQILKAKNKEILVDAISKIE